MTPGSAHGETVRKPLVTFGRAAARRGDGRRLGRRRGGAAHAVRCTARGPAGADPGRPAHRRQPERAAHAAFHAWQQPGRPCTGRPAARKGHDLRGAARPSHAGGGWHGAADPRSEGASHPAGDRPAVSIRRAGLRLAHRRRGADRAPGRRHRRAEGHQGLRRGGPGAGPRRRRAPEHAAERAASGCGRSLPAAEGAGRRGAAPRRSVRAGFAARAGCRGPTDARAGGLRRRGRCHGEP